MFIVENYSTAVLLCVVTMICCSSVPTARPITTGVAGSRWASSRSRASASCWRRDDEAGLCNRVRGLIVLVGIWVIRIVRVREVEVEDAPVLLRQAAVPVIPHAGRQAYVRCDLKLVLGECSQLVRAVIPVRIALQKRGHVEIRRRAAGRHVTLREGTQVVRSNGACAGALVDRVQLRIAVADAKRECMPAQRPDRVARRLEPVLKYAGVGRLSFRVRANVKNARTRQPEVVRFVAQHIHNRNAREIGRSKFVDRHGA